MSFSDYRDKMNIALSKKNRKVEFESYFEEDEEDNDSSNNNGNGTGNLSVNDKDSKDNDIDPLDLYMSTIQTSIQKDSEKVGSREYVLAQKPEILSYSDDEDDGFNEYTVTNHKYNNNNEEEEEDLKNDDDDDEDNELINRKIKKKISTESIFRVDHSQIQYRPFIRSLYRIHPEMKIKTKTDIETIRDELEVMIDVNGTSNDNVDSVPAPIERFEHCCFDIGLLREIYAQGYLKPTPIQAQAIPIILSGRDLIALAETGSGKTLAFIWPLLIHVKSQPSIVKGEGPVGLILAPTRELVIQIYQQVSKFSKVYNLTVRPIYGGAGKYEMMKALKESPHIVVATPGRMIEMLKVRATNLERCTIVIFDEADVMFELGFESQITSILNNIRGDRQVLLFSATMKKRIEDFVRNTILHPSSGKVELKSAYSGIDEGLVRIIIGKLGQANSDIQQKVIIHKTDDEKWKWLISNMDDFIASGKVLLFVSGKQTTETICNNLKEYFFHRQLDVVIQYLHGDVDQTERLKIVRSFSKSSGSIGEISVLIATDIASRGLDIKNIQTVINYEVPKNIQVYVHRIGRTGRLGIDGVKPGIAYTLLLISRDSSFAVDLVQNLLLSNQIVPQELQLLAETDVKWSRVKHRIDRKGSTSYHGSSQGLGSVGIRKAMTSEMMANDSTKKIHMNISSATTLFDKLISSSLSSSLSSSSSLSNQVQSVENQFLRNQSQPKNILPPVSVVSIASSPVLKGFVRSSQNLSSVSEIERTHCYSQPSASLDVNHNNNNNASKIHVNVNDTREEVQNTYTKEFDLSVKRKRSRWDS